MPWAGFGVEILDESCVVAFCSLHSWNKVSDVVLMGVYILTFNRNRSRDTRYECGPDVKI